MYCAYLASASRHECDVLGDSGRASTTQACGKGCQHVGFCYTAGNSHDQHHSPNEQEMHLT